jgi:hypothetical protein
MTQTDIHQSIQFKRAFFCILLDFFVVAIQTNKLSRITCWYHTGPMIHSIFLRSVAMLFLALTTSRRMKATAFRAGPITQAYRLPVRLFSSSEEASSREESSSTVASTSSADDPWAIYRNTNNMRDQVFSAISGDGGIKVTVATIRNMVNDISLQHTMTAIPTDALGRTVACSLLMANGIQEEQMVQITINGKYVGMCI